MSSDINELKNILEGALLAAGRPLSVDQLGALFDDDHRPARADIKTNLDTLQEDYQGRGIELAEVASGYRFQVREAYSSWISKLWEEKPPRYSRAMLETLSLVAYRQPITRGDIESIRGVAVSSHIMKSLLERDWVRIVGHRDVPGRPAMFATTRAFLDYFNLKNLDELPPLADIRELGKINEELELEDTDAKQPPESDELTRPTPESLAEVSEPEGDDLESVVNEVLESNLDADAGNIETPDGI